MHVAIFDYNTNEIKQIVRKHWIYVHKPKGKISNYVIFQEGPYTHIVED